MWMRQNIHRRSYLRPYINRTGVIHEDKRTHHSSQAERKYPAYIHTWTQRCLARSYYNIEHSKFLSFLKNENSLINVQSLSWDQSPLLKYIPFLRGPMAPHAYRSTQWRAAIAHVISLR